jgi:hypothetical protein
LKYQLHTDFSLGTDKYPKTVDAAILALNSQATTIVRVNQFLQSDGTPHNGTVQIRASRDGITDQGPRVCY